MNLAQYAAATRITPAAFRKLLADEYGLVVEHETVRAWFKGKNNPRPQNMPVIEAATGGKVKREHQRPDDYRLPKRRRSA